MWSLLGRIPGARRQENRPGPDVGVGFIDVLFGIAASEAFARLFQASPVQASHLILALVLIALSWIGYHKTPSPSKVTERFWSLGFVQFFLDIAIIFLYYWLVFFAGRRHSLAKGMVWEAGLLVAVFVGYAVWDALANVIAGTCQVRRRLVADLAGVLVMSLIWLLLSQWYHVTTRGEVFACDAVYVLALYGYRVWQQEWQRSC